MSSETKNDQLRHFRKQEPTDLKKQSSILRFVRRDPIQSDKDAENGVSSSSSLPASPKISTIVVRKPASVVSIGSSAASTTAKAYSAFNAFDLNSVKTETAKDEQNISTNGTCKDDHLGSSGSSSPVLGSSFSASQPEPASPTSNGTNGASLNSMLFIDSPYKGAANSPLLESSQDSPIIRVKVVKKNLRISDSDDDDDDDTEDHKPPQKKLKAEHISTSENVLCKDFTEKPLHLIDKYLDTLVTLYPHYERMELQDILMSWNYNFSEASCFLEKEEQRRKQLQLKQTKLERIERLKQQVEEKNMRNQLQTEKEKERQLVATQREKERKEMLEMKAMERLKLVEVRQKDRQLQQERKEREKQIKAEVERLRQMRLLQRDGDNRKMQHREKIQTKKQMFKMIGASSRFQQQDADDDDEDVYIGKSNVYVSDDSDEEGEEKPDESSDVANMRQVVLSFLNDSTDQEIYAIPGCSKKKGDIIISKRPYSDWDHLVRVFKCEKHISPEILNNVKNVLHKRCAVNHLMKRCEFIAADIQNTVTQLVNGEETETAISKQPALLNPNMQLKGYQMIGLNWLSLMLQHGLNGVLADEMGLGKTVQAIAFLAHVTETFNPEDLSLIVVPSSTLDNWARELDLWCPSMGVLMYHGSQEERRGMRIQILNDQLDDNTKVILTTYNMVYSCSEDRALFKRLKIHTVIFDEAHMLKNMNSQRFENLMRISADCRILLTGTPLQNNLVELMSILVFVMPQLFEGRKEELKQVFAMFPKSDERDKSQYESKRIEQAKRIMKPFFLRRLKDDVLKDLPAKHETLVSIEMPESQRTLYDTVVQALSRKAKQMSDKLENLKLTELEELEEGAVPKAILGKAEGSKDETQPGESSANMLMTLRRLANHPLLHRKHYNDTLIREISTVLKNSTHRDSILSYIVEDFSVMSDYEIHQTCAMYSPIKKYRLEDEHVLNSGKFVHFDKMLPEMQQNGDRVLIFSQFVIMLNIIEEYMKIRGYKFLRLDGQTPVTERQEMIDEYNDDPSIFVFLLSTRAGGLGINLTSANTVFLHDIDFNPYNDKQAEDRCHRVGQTRPVSIIRFVTKDSIEEGIRAIAQSKLELEKEVTGIKDDQHKKGDVVTLLKAALGLVKTD